MRTLTIFSIALLISFMAQCSQIQEGSELNRALTTTTAAVTGRTLAEQHAWWNCKYNNGETPEFSANQLGQDDIRHPNNPISDSQYDDLFVPADVAVALQSSPGQPVTVCGPRQTDQTTWINIKHLNSMLRYAPGSRQNPVMIASQESVDL